MTETHNQLGGNGSRPGTGRTLYGRKGIIRLGLLALVMSFAMGNQRCPEDPDAEPTLDCDALNVLVEPGTCTTFANPCADNGSWSAPPDLDGLRLDPTTDAENALIAAAHVSLVTTRTGDETTRSICVAENATHVHAQNIRYLYGLGSDFGRQNIVLTVAPLLNVSVMATPSAIVAGGQSQLLATASGGIPPYFFSWTPSASLDIRDIAAPRASPTQTTTYVVDVRDSGGQQRSASITVFVGFALTVTAQPDSINPGDSSQLLAEGIGGTPPYIYLWTPTDSLNDPHRADPTASPLTTTTYQVTAVDSVGATKNGSVKLTVTTSPPLTASFVFNITCCPTLNLDASASTGSIVSYTWDLSWTTASPDRVTMSPSTSFTFREFDRGTITLTVADAAGHTATTTRNFP